MFSMISSEEDLIKKIQSNRLECGYVFHKNLRKELDRSHLKNLITVYVSENTTCTGILNELVYANLFEEYSLTLLQDSLTTAGHLPFTDGDRTESSLSPVTKEEIEQAKENPCIVHYTSSFMVARPWEYGREHPYKYLWNTYKELSPWKEKIHKEKKMKKWKKVYVALSEKMPYRVNLIFSGILQAYIRPINGKWKYREEILNSTSIISKR